MRFLLLILLSFPFFSQSAVILKVKGNNALVHLEGIVTSRGSYFEVYNLEGSPAGLVKIKRVGNKKAIGELQLGKIKPRWSMEPKSTRWAMAKLKKNKKERLALIKKQKRKKLLAAKKRRILRAKKRRRQQLLAQKRKKQKLQRELAEFNREEEYVLNDNEILYSNEDSDNDYSHSDEKSSYGKKDNITFSVSFQPEATFNMMRIVPPTKSSVDPFRIAGPGFGGSIFLDTEFHKNISLGLQAGYRRFSAGSSATCPPEGRKCSLKVDYAIGGFALKTHTQLAEMLTVFGGLNGKFMFPIGYINDARLSANAFNGLHGTLGFISGFEIALDNIKIPLTLGLDIMMPPTETTLTIMGGASLGFGFTF